MSARLCAPSSARRPITASPPPIILCAACALLGPTLVACSSGQSLATHPAVTVSAAGDAEPTDASHELAAQARRDVEQMQAMGATGSSGTVGADTGPQQIQWTTLPGQSSSPGATPTSSPLAHLDPPPLQRPVHRDKPPISFSTAADSGTGGEPGIEEVPGGAVPEATESDDPELEGEQADRLRQLVVELSAELYRMAAYSDMPMRELLLIAATTMVTPDRSLVPDALPGLTDREREILATMQSHFAELGAKLRESGDPEQVVAAVELLHQTLARPPSLSLPQAALCTRVGGFGDFDEFPQNDSDRYAFLAHANQEAIVYVEVEDFTSELNGQGQWVTELSQQLVVYSDRDGIPVWHEPWQAGVDISKNEREDFFIVQIIRLPDRLSVGRYHLKIHIRDEKSGAEAERSMEFEMVADPRMIQK